MRKILLPLILTILLIPLISLAQGNQNSTDFSIETNPTFDKFTYDLSELFVDLNELSVELKKAVKRDDNERVREIIIKALNIIKRFQEQYRDYPIRVEGFSVGFPAGFSINIGVL